MITQRQQIILETIVDEYVKNGKPIGSQQVLDAGTIKIASATIRYEMVALEERGYLEKSHISSGRIPTNKAYEYYLNNIKDSDLKTGLLRTKIEDLFKNRTNSIDTIFKKTLELINNSTNTMVVSRKNPIDAKFEDLRLYELDDNRIILIAIASNGQVFENELFLDYISLEDFKSCVNIFVERLRGTPLSEVLNKALKLKDIIQNQIKTLEYNFQDFIRLMFDNITIRQEQSSGVNNLINTDSLVNNEAISKLITLVENKTIWDLINNSKSITTNNTRITIEIADDELGEISIVNKDFNFKGDKRSIAIVGPKNQDYKKVIQILDLIDLNIKKL